MTNSFAINHPNGLSDYYSRRHYSVNLSYLSLYIDRELSKKSSAPEYFHLKVSKLWGFVSFKGVSGKTWCCCNAVRNNKSAGPSGGSTNPHGMTITLDAATALQSGNWMFGPGWSLYVLFNTSHSLSCARISSSFVIAFVAPFVRRFIKAHVQKAEQSLVFDAPRSRLFLLAVITNWAPFLRLSGKLWPPCSMTPELFPPPPPPS